MDFPGSAKETANNLIGGLKDKFGFGGNRQNSDEFYDDYYDDGYDDYGQDGYNSYDAPSNQYDSLEYTTRSTGSHAYNPRRSGSASLVSSRDIRATTSAYGVSDFGTTRMSSVSAVPAVPAAAEPQVPSSAEVAESLSTPAAGYGDFVSPYKRNGSASGSGISSPGLDSLFTPSTGSASAASAVSAAATSAAPATAEQPAVSDPYTAYETGASLSTSTARAISVVKPVSYEDVSTVARSVRAGDIVVLSLRQTDASLSKRILDFSFGVASALNAKVDCVSEKTFTVVQGGELTLEERHNLAKQGFMKA